MGPVLEDPAAALALRRERLLQQFGGVLEREHPTVLQPVDEPAMVGRGIGEDRVQLGAAGVELA